MTRLAMRLSRVESNIMRRRPQASTAWVLWQDELVACLEHPRCYTEPETGRHHGGVIDLSFGTPGRPTRETQ